MPPDEEAVCSFPATTISFQNMLFSVRQKMTPSCAAQSAKLLKAAYAVLDIKMWSLFLGAKTILGWETAFGISMLLYWLIFQCCLRQDP